MARWNVSTKNSLDSFDHTAIEISPTGAATYSGPNMHKIHFANLQLVSLPSNALWDSNPLSSPGRENPQNSLPSTHGYSVVRRHGMRLIPISREQFVDQVNKPIVTSAQIQITSRVNGSGCPLGTFVSGYPAKRSVPGTWVHSKFLDK